MDPLHTHKGKNILLETSIKLWFILEEHVQEVNVTHTSQGQ